MTSIAVNCHQYQEPVGPISENREVHPEFERVHPTTVQWLYALLPPQGLVFLQRVLRLALAKQYSLPDAGENVAVIQTKSLYVLAQELGLAYETTHKYVLICCALGLLQRRALKGRRVALLFPLRIYQPPDTLESDLDRLIATGRPKVRALARQIKERCLLHGLISQTIISSLEHVLSLLQPESVDSNGIRRGRKQRMAQAYQFTTSILKTLLTPSLVDSTPAGLTFESTCTVPAGEDAETAQHSRLPVRTRVVDATVTRQPLASPRTDLSGRREDQGVLSRLPSRAYLVDANVEPPPLASPGIGQPGRRETHSLPSRLPERTKVVDATSQESVALHSPMLYQTHQEADAPLSRPPEGADAVDAKEPLRNVDVDSIYNFITFTLREPRHVAEFFAEQFEQDRRVYPKYQKLMQREPGQKRDGHVLAAAFICTMVRWRRDGWNLTRPGGFFTARCREYDEGVPEEVETWLTRYGTLSARDLGETLAREQSATQPSAGASSSAPCAPERKLAPASRPRIALSPTTVVDPARLVMTDRQEAYVLASAIEHNERRWLLQARVVCVGTKHSVAGSHRYVILVDGTLPGERPREGAQTIVYSVSDWQERLATVRLRPELFAPPETASSASHEGRQGT